MGKRFKGWIFAGAVIVFFIFQSFAARNYSQSQRLGDEIGHLVGGHFITKGLVPYKDLQLNHQPLVYLFSAATEKLTTPNSLYTYVGRQRMALFVYAAAWQIIYFLVFGAAGFLFALIFEIVKYSNSGYKLLGETLAVYPLVFMFGLAARRWLLDKTITAIHLILFSVSSFIAVFSLLPLWPAVVVLNLVLFWVVRKNRRKILFLFSPFLVLMLILFLYLPAGDYVRETVIYNWHYLMPVLDRIKTVDGYTKMIFLPFMALFSLPDINSQIIVFFLVIYAFLTYRFWRGRKIVVWSLFFIVLTLSNLRVAEVKSDNFHLLPYLAVYVFLGVYFLLNYSRRLGAGLLLIFTIWLYLNYFKSLFPRQNLQTEHYNNYELSQRYGAAVAAIKDVDDRLISIPYDPLIYWIADIRPAIRVLEYYSWIYAIPEYRRELKTVFKKNPPEFVVDAGLDEDGRLDQVVIGQLAKKYIRTSHLDAPSNLYILKQKIPEISKKQWRDFKYLLFDAP